jgi:hypothetical protein
MTYKNEVMEEIEKEYAKSSESLIKKVDWSTDDTIFLCGIILAGFTTILCFIL